ncbi:MAG: ATP-binding cassette domain-containing protein [Lysobacterales bacterium]|jgi:iron complex transport system ATP-binding protein
MTEAPLIEIHNATVWRGSTRVFRDFSLTIDRHERVAVLGPNGAGKTTLLQTINRELYPVVRENSWIRILGRERWNVWDLREDIGWVSQDLQARFLPNSTVLDAVVSGYFSTIGVHAQLRDSITVERLDHAGSLIRGMGLEGLEDREFRTLSTGQQRRCLLARALVHDPHSLILDEPTSGLDMTASFDLLTRIRGLARRGRSLVLVSHHLSDIPPEIERVVLLKNGRVAADGPKASVLTEEWLSAVYETRLRLAENDGFYFAWPAGEPPNCSSEPLA